MTEKRRARPKKISSPPEIADSIRRDIQSGVYEPGRHLGTIELAKRFGVSRGPVREALRLLESRNFVRVVPRRGAFVIAPDDDELLQLLSMRTVLFALTCELAAKEIGENGGAATRLKGQLRQLRELSVDPQCTPRKFQNVGYEIAETLCEVAAVPRLTSVQRELTLGAAMAYGYLSVATQEMRVAEAGLFEVLIKAVCAGRAEDAFAAARKLNEEGIARGVALAALAPRRQGAIELKGRRIRRH